MTEHSHLGASGAERWMHCPGSVALVRRFGKHEDDGDGPDYRWQGTVAHAAIADCLEHGFEAWEVVGKEYEGHTLTAALSEGVAFYLSVVLPHLSDPRTSLVMVEEETVRAGHPPGPVRHHRSGVRHGQHAPHL